MWDYILAVLIGAAIPLITLWFQSKEKRKYFELERKEKFKLVAIEKRLEAHQQAIKQWEILQSVIHKPDEEEKSIIISGVRDFWLNSCLYLEKETREKLNEAIWIVSSYKMWLEMYKEMDPGKEKEDHKKFFLGCWDDFHKLFEIIQKEVVLEPIKPEVDKTPEGKEIEKETKKKK